LTTDPTLELIDDHAPGERTEEPTREEVSKWQNLNSFVARLTEVDFAPWLNFPIWDLSSALEDPPFKGANLNCQLWVVTEWILRCADVMLNYLLLAADEELGIKRWNFWKKRLVEISANRGDLGIDDVMCRRISAALQKMAAIEELNNYRLETTCKL
jgi:hypothetical protein